MAICCESSTTPQEFGSSSLESSVPRWYVVHTFSHHERHVDERLTAKNLNTFLPLYVVKRYSKNAAPPIEKPLFPGYLFVFVPLLERLKVLQVPGVVKLVGFGGKPTPLADHEVEALRTARTMGVQTEPHVYIEIGNRVRIISGPFEGFQGILIRHKGRYRVVLAIELIASSFVLDVDSSIVERVKAVGPLGPAVRCPCEPFVGKKCSPRNLPGMGGMHVSP